MLGKRFAVSVGIMAMVLVIAAGCGRPAAQKKNPAEERAVAFYTSLEVTRDFAAAWDMTTPGVFPEYTTKEQFIEGWQKLKLSPKPARAITIQKYERVDDRLYLLSTAQEQMLVWVTQTPEGWKVRKYQWYSGGEIPW